ncbi:DNA-binding NarL/FixJ family response regulator [Mycobacterium sp. URHB0021]|jgi:two-component system, NarL family, nitrate/nitrite response regulator NarL
MRGRAQPQGPVLSPREAELVRLIAAGSSIPALANELYLAPSTLKTHVQQFVDYFAAQPIRVPRFCGCQSSA